MKLQWGVQYETDVQPRMDGTTAETQIQSVLYEETARDYARAGIPLGGRNHQVVKRYISDWMVDGETQKTRQIIVELPAEVDEEGLFEAVADAAIDWEPDNRDGWDVDVSSTVIEYRRQET